jgi:hypothetical protein
MSNLYFEKFPVVPYSMKGDNVEQVVTNIMLRVKVLEKLKNRVELYQPHSIEDGETPNVLAHKFYGDSYWFWVIMLYNNRYLLWRDWPMTYAEFNSWIIKTYGDVRTAYQTTHHFEDIFGNEIDETTFNSLGSTQRRRVSAYDYHLELNDSKRFIKILNPALLPQINDELRSLLNTKP